MNKVLILMGRYLPGHKDGGPLRTIVNVTNLLGNEFEFYILTTDRDHGDTEPYPGIVHNSWEKVGNANVMYVKPRGFTFSLLKKLALDFDVIYSCGYFNDYGYKTLILNRLNKLNGCPVYVASMGVFSDAAFHSKYLKKKIFSDTLKMLGCFKNIVWSVTSELEKNDLIKHIGKNVKYVIAEDVPRSSIETHKEKTNNKLSLVFISRLASQKNLSFAIDVVSKLGIEVIFDIYGPKFNDDYCNECFEKLKNLPSGVSWHYYGDLKAESVPATFSKYDLFLFPTLVENYGHVIFESLSAGCVPVISDTTPWNFIEEKNAGYVCSLSSTDAFVYCIEKYNKLTCEAKNEIMNNAYKVAKEKIEQSRNQTGYRYIFSNSCEAIKHD